MVLLCMYVPWYTPMVQYTHVRLYYYAMPRTYECTRARTPLRDVEYVQVYVLVYGTRVQKGLTFIIVRTYGRTDV
jgi:hypothetical protein